MESPQAHLAALGNLVPSEWNAEAVEALDRWKQGDIFPGLPLAWTALPGLDAITGIEQSSADDEMITMDTPGRPWGVVTSQTCDIAATGPGRLHPFIQASPVISAAEVTNEAALTIARGEIGYLAPLYPPSLDGLYIADLRISVAVSKSVLLSQEPVEGFGSEASALEFATRLAIKYERPAVHGFISETMIGVIRQHIRGTRKQHNTSWWTPVYEVRAAATPTRLQPTRVDIHVIGKRELSPAEQYEWLAPVNEMRTLAAKLSPKIEVANPVHWTTANLTAAVYRSSVQLNVPELRTPSERS